MSFMWQSQNSSEVLGGEDANVDHMTKLYHTSRHVITIEAYSEVPHGECHMASVDVGHMTKLFYRSCHVAITKLKQGTMWQVEE